MKTLEIAIIDGVSRINNKYELSILEDIHIIFRDEDIIIKGGEITYRYFDIGYEAMVFQDKAETSFLDVNGEIRMATKEEILAIKRALANDLYIKWTKKHNLISQIVNETNPDNIDLITFN